MIEPAYWAFLSYSSQDRAWASWLRRALETYELPRRYVGLLTASGAAPRRLRPVFRDREELAASADLGVHIERALGQSRSLIVLCSSAAAASRWVSTEIRQFRQLHGERPILCVIVGGSPTRGAADNCFPDALRERHEEGSPADLVPAAADLRPHGDGRRLALLKIVAGILNLGLDDLVRRDEQRRRRRLLGLSAASMAGMAAMGGLAALALVAAGEAREQRNEAEGLVDFMLTDLRGRLEPAGRLDLMDSIGRETLRHYAAQRPDELDARSLAHRARALQLLGEISAKRGRLDEAQRDFDAAAATTAVQIARAPRDGERVFNHAQSVFWGGQIAYQRGDTRRAEAAFRDYLDLAQRLVALDPTRDDWWGEVAYAYSNLGTLMLEQGRPALAADAFARSLAVSQTLANRRPAELTRQLDLGQARAWFADALEQEGRLAASRQQRLAEIAIYRRMLASDPGVETAEASLIVALEAVARLDQAEGDRGRALAGFAAAAARGETLLARQPSNMDWDAALSVAYLELADARLASGEVTEADRAVRRAEALITIALGHDATVELWRNYNRYGLLIESEIDAAHRRSAAALALCESVIDALGASSAKQPLNAYSLWLRNRAKLDAGDDLAALGRRSEARAEWAAILREFPGPAPTYEPRLRMVLSAARDGLASSPRLN